MEIVLFMVLISRSNDEDNLIPVIRAAILGSMLANLLLCLGCCFFAGGLRRDEQEFDEVIGEMGKYVLLESHFPMLDITRLPRHVGSILPERCFRVREQLEREITDSEINF